MTFWIAQMIGVLALGLTVLAFQSKTRGRILSVQAMGSFFFVIHFLLLSAYIGAFMNLIVIARNFVFKNSKQNSAWLYAFIAISLCILAFSWQGWISIFPALGTMIGTYALWHKHPATIRTLLLVSTIAWIPYTVFVHSYAGLVNQIVVAIAILMGMFRFDRKNNETAEYTERV